METQEFKTIGNNLPIRYKNEQKTKLFIFVKHMIQDADQKTISRVERYVNNYCRLNSADIQDKLTLKQLFNQKLKSL